METPLAPSVFTDASSNRQLPFAVCRAVRLAVWLRGTASETGPAPSTQTIVAERERIDRSCTDATMA